MILDWLYSVEGGELFDRVISVGRFEEPVAKFLFLQMVYGVKVSAHLSLVCSKGTFFHFSLTDKRSLVL